MHPIPSLTELVAPIAALGHKRIKELSPVIGVPRTTLYRLCMGYQEGCNYDTARKISLYLASLPPGSASEGPSAP